MKTPRFLIVIGLSLGLSRAAFAICGSGLDCERPDFNGTTITLWNVSSTRLSGMKVLNSVGPTGNPANSAYYFAVTTTDRGAQTANGTITASGNGLTQIGNTSTTNGSNVTPGSIVSGGSVTGILGGTAYWVYAQACPTGTATANGTNCSAWSKINNSQTTTVSYPGTVFSAISKPGDADIDSINARVAVANGDTGDVSLVHIRVNDLINSLNDTFDIAFSVNGVYPLDNSLYSPGFRANTKYNYVGHVVYPFSHAVPTPDQTVATFWTTPALPGTISVSNITHCSAQITSQNSVGAPSNPAYTTYNLCAVGTAGSCLVDQVSGGTSGDTAVATITNLNPGTPYTPTAQSQVGNTPKDGTESGWNSSTIKNGSGFSTLAWGGTFVINNVTTGAADAVISGVTTTPSLTWQIKLNGNTVASGDENDLNGTHTLSGLLPNTEYDATIALSEGGTCTSTLNFNPNSFTTDPFAPTAGTITATAARSLRANFTDASANPNGATSTYEVQVCLNAGFSSGCASTTGSKAAGAAQVININSGIIPETQYFAQVRTRNQSRPTWPDSAWFNLGNDTTPNEAPSVVSGPTFTLHVTSGTLRVTATDNAAASGLVFNWTVNASGTGNPTLTSASGNTTIGGSNATNTTQLTFTQNGTYSGNVTITDHNGTGGMSIVVPWSTGGVSQVPTSITISGGSASTVTGGATPNFTATVRDQFNVVMVGQTVSWSATGSGNSMSPASGSATSSFHAGLFTGTFSITAFIGSVTSAPTSVQVLPAGPVFVTPPSLTLNGDHKTGNVTTLGNDNTSGFGESSLTYNWSLESGPAGASISVSPNNTNASKNAVVTFNMVGPYVLRCTITNSNGSNAATTSPVTLAAFLTSVRVSPPHASISISGSQPFTASGLDQFNNAMPPLSGVVWTSGGSGNVSNSGVFQPSGLGQGIRITATSNGVSGTAFLDIFNYDVSSAHPFPVPFKSTLANSICFTGLGTDATIRIYTTSGRKVFEKQVTNSPTPTTPPNCDYAWPVTNSAGEKVASGVYLYRIESPTTTKNGKLVIIQ